MTRQTLRQLSMNPITTSRWRLLAGLALSATLAPCADKARLDPNLPAYQPQGGLRGELRSVGADVMDAVTLGWIELFRLAHPKVTATMEARAPGTAIPALVNGWGHLGPVARELFPHEEEQFVGKFGYKPTAVRVATASLDHAGTAQTLVICVHESNPLAMITLEQLGEIYARGGAITKWGQLGLTGDWAERPIEAWGLKRPNGVANFLQTRVLGGREFRAGINERVNLDDVPALDAITTGVAASRFSIGYSGLGSVRSGVKVLALAARDGGPAVAPTREEIASHRYPLSRFVYIYVNLAPGQRLAPNVREFLRLVLSREGQTVVARQGLYLPLTAEIARAELAKLD
jgi:phosphate transport system substrate-binding protein